jgi:hypothetical protein
MKARELIDGAAPFYSQDALSVIRQAFDQAWAHIAGDVGKDPTEVDVARGKLAVALLAAGDASRDAGALRDAALKIMRADANTP